MTQPRARTKWVLFATALLTVPVLVGIAEIAVRVFSDRMDPLAVFVTSPQLRSDTQGETTRGMFEFDPLLCWRLKPNLRGIWWDFTPVSTNARHLRMDREVGAKKATRIVILGDSVTFGYRVPTAHDATKPHEFEASEKPYPALLEELLRKKAPGRTFEILPLACPGYTSWQGLAWLKRDIAELKPDFVIACFGWNDVRSAGLPDRITMPASGAQVFVRRLIGNSQLLLSIAAAAQRRTPVPLSTAQPEPRSSAEEYVAHFLEMEKLCRQHGAWCGILLPVYRDPNTAGIDPENPGDPGAPDEGERMTRYRAQLRDAAKKNQIPALEIAELTERSWPANRTLFGERIHPNAAGHALMAEALAEFLSEPLSHPRP
ncbi:MAG: GDSL-type esterase/lipase family protein [Chthoniobacteraceae bacterium]